MSSSGPPPTLLDHPTLIAQGSMRRVRGLDPSPALFVPDVAATQPPPRSPSPPSPVLRPSTGSELDFAGLLGTGGLNQVYRARHRELQREVAVKRVRPDQDREEVRELLLREARVTGTLEHPGVVPIYDLRWSAEGEPLVLMQRIEGESWGRLIHDHALWQRRFGSEGHWLHWQLRVLARVCEVVHFAHSRGFLHRDLKPDNVMIGAQGEVMLVDWGLAVALPELPPADCPEGLPRADRITKASGTPAYMAPEMLGKGAALDARTDVFLLGGVLFELLAGRPPYVGSVDKDLVARIRAADVRLDDEPHPWLAAIQARAMAREPDDRYASADELRRVLQHYLEHQDADRLARAAQDELASLLQDAGSPEPDRDQVYLLLGKVRLGFQQALLVWPHHEGAAEGLRQATEAVARMELEQGRAEAAAVLLGELEDPPLELRQKLAALQEETRTVAEVGRDYDPRRGARTRTFVLVVLGLLFALAPWLPQVASERRPEDLTYPDMLMISAMFAAVVVSLGLWARESLTATRINRTIVGGLLLVQFGQVAFDLGAWAAGLAPLTAMGFHILLWAGISAALALVFDRRIWWTTAAFVLAYAVSMRWPQWTFPMVSFCAVSLIATATGLGIVVLGPRGLFDRGAGPPPG